MKKKAKKLSLTKETLGILEKGTFNKAAGGQSLTECDGCSAYTCINKGCPILPSEQQTWA